MTGLQVVGIICGLIYIICGALGIIVGFIILHLFSGCFSDIIDKIKNSRISKPCYKCKTKKKWVFKPRYCTYCKLSKNKDLFEKE